MTVSNVARTGENQQVVVRAMATLTGHISSVETSGGTHQANHLVTTGDGVEDITGTTETEGVSGTIIVRVGMEVAITSPGVGIIDTE